MTIWAGTLMLYLILDPVGNTPLLITLLKDTPAPRRAWVIVRENLIALAVLLFFLLFGRPVLDFLGIHGPELQIAGGVVIFLMSLRMVFPTRGGIMGEDEFAGEPFVVPLAIPLIAGPECHCGGHAVHVVSPRPHRDAWRHHGRGPGVDGLARHLAVGAPAGPAPGSPRSGGYGAADGHGAVRDCRPHPAHRDRVVFPRVSPGVGDRRRVRHPGFRPVPAGCRRGAFEQESGTRRSWTGGPGRGVRGRCQASRCLFPLEVSGTCVHVMPGSRDFGRASAASW